MMDYRNMSDEQLDRLQYAAVSRGNLNANREIAEFREVYGKRVKVVKGRKVPIGTVGVVFWVKRYDNSKYGDPWGIYSNTRVGIETETGEKVFTAFDNIEVLTA